MTGPILPGSRVQRRVKRSPDPLLQAPADAGITMAPAPMIVIGRHPRAQSLDQLDGSGEGDPGFENAVRIHEDHS